ncbi:MAG: MFS transporter [Planctomycetes bacterium]|nr:MFS transporter [Planctomycetota bacterium]
MKKLTWRHTGRFFRAAFWMDFSSATFIVALPYFALKLGGDSLDLGILGAARGVAYLVACIPVALLADRARRNRLIGIAAVGIALALVLTSSADKLWHLYFGAVLWAISLSFFWPSLFAWLGDAHDPANLARATGVVNLGWSSGSIVGSLLSGWLFQIAIPLPFFIALIGVCLARFAPAHKEDQGDPQTEISSTESASPGTKRRLAACWLGNTAVCCLIGLMTGVFPKLGTTIGIESGIFGLMVAALGLARTGVFWASFQGARAPHKWSLSVIAQIVSAALIATLATASNHLWLGLVYIFIGITLGFVYSLSLYASLADVGSRGLKSGLHEAALLGGILLGTVGGGVVANRFGLRTPYIPAAAVVLCLVVVQITLHLSASHAEKKHRQEDAESTDIS